MLNRDLAEYHTRYGQKCIALLSNTMLKPRGEPFFNSWKNTSKLSTPTIIITQWASKVASKVDAKNVPDKCESFVTKGWCYYRLDLYQIKRPTQSASSGGKRRVQGQSR